ncbi:MAG: hypothetical protein JWQ97_307 [Phenylobacterium sp.]|nr:hypothetical protein [Phenylobacterium sp.]
MAGKSAERGQARVRAVPAELMNIIGLIAALFGVVATGVAISAALPHGADPWLNASAYGAPAAVAFAVYWWIAQRA